MGLIERGNPLSGRPLEPSHPTPQERGYPGLNPQTFPRRGFFSLAARLIIPGAAASVALATAQRRTEADGGQPLVGPDYLDNYIAGGKELNDPGQFSDRVFPHPLTGSAVLVSPDVFQALGAPFPDQLAQRTRNSPWAQSLNWANRFESAVLAIDGAYGFKANAGGQVNVYLLDNPSGTRISTPGYTTGRLQPKWWESKDLSQSGLVLTDGYTAAYDYQPGGWQERDEYYPIGTYNTRVVKSLRYSAQKLQLNPVEIDQFDQTGDDAGLTSFQLMRKPSGEPVFFAVADGPFGLDPKLGNLQALPEVTARLNNMTWRGKNLLDLMINNWGFRTLIGTEHPVLQNVISRKGPTAATYLASDGGVILNEKSAVHSRGSVIDLLITLIVEPRHIDSVRHFPRTDKLLDPNAGIDKAMVLEEIANENRSLFIGPEYDYTISQANFIAEEYRGNPL